jgi:hypothetical protein
MILIRIGAMLENSIQMKDKLQNCLLQRSLQRNLEGLHHNIRTKSNCGCVCEFLSEVIDEAL